MTKPPAHAHLIKQWADGAVIQYLDLSGWRDCSNNLPAWLPALEYRVKPEPKPDRIEIRGLTYNPEWGIINMQGAIPNIQFVFDGETGVLKDVQLLAKE